jgi:hypothetical protein
VSLRPPPPPCRPSARVEAPRSSPHRRRTSRRRRCVRERGGVSAWCRFNSATRDCADPAFAALPLRSCVQGSLARPPSSRLIPRPRSGSGQQPIGQLSAPAAESSQEQHKAHYRRRSNTPAPEPPQLPVLSSPGSKIPPPAVTLSHRSPIDSQLRAAGAASPSAAAAAAGPAQSPAPQAPLRGGAAAADSGGRRSRVGSSGEAGTVLPPALHVAPRAPQASPGTSGSPGAGVPVSSTAAAAAAAHPFTPVARPASAAVTAAAAAAAAAPAAPASTAFSDILSSAAAPPPLARPAPAPPQPPQVRVALSIFVRWQWIS